MKIFLLFFISLITTTTFTAQVPVLASVETTTSIIPPVEKNKVKKKQRKKKRLKKPNHNSKTKGKAARVRLIVLTAIFLTVALLVFLIFLVFGVAISIEAVLISALISLGLGIAGFALLVVSIIYNIASRQKEKKAALPLKKSAETLKKEVAYLNKEKVARYLALNEQLVAFEITKRNANAILKNKTSTPKEQSKAKITLSNLKQDMKQINRELKELRQQNSIKKARRERNS